METELLKILKEDPEAKYSLHYSDYKDGCWTLPVLLKDYRIRQFANDPSLQSCLVFLSNGKKITFNQ